MVVHVTAWPTGHRTGKWEIPADVSNKDADSYAGLINDRKPLLSFCESSAHGGKKTMYYDVPNLGRGYLVNAKRGATMCKCGWTLFWSRRYSEPKRDS